MGAETSPSPLVCAVALYTGPPQIVSTPTRDRSSEDAWKDKSRKYGGLKIADYESGHSYHASYIQFKCPREGIWSSLAPYKDQWMTVCSTPASCRAAKAENPKAWLQCDVWVGKEDPQVFPRVEYSERLGTVEDMFPKQVFDSLDVMHCLRDMGNEYHWCWTGYHIHGVAVSAVDTSLCPLDVYYQTRAQRCDDPDVYEHYIITDVAEPCMAYVYDQKQYLGKAVREGYYI